MPSRLEKFDPADNSDRIDNIEAAHEQALLKHTESFFELQEKEQDIETKKEFAKVLEISQAVSEQGGLVLVVGGFARDMVLRKFGYDVDPKDIDIEVYGLSAEQLQTVLAQHGEINLVGQSFGVYKLGNIDISIPRKDSKTGTGHKEFSISQDPNMTVSNAAKRRDFTMNAISLNPLTGEVVDKVGGIEDIQNKVLRATDFELFKDDPLRVLRAMQFAGRFGFKVEPETVALCRKMVESGELKELSKERFEEEWYKLLLKSPAPSVGLETAR